MSMTPTEIREWRRANGYTRAQLASVLPVSVRTLESWEQGTRPAPDYLWRALRDLETYPKN